MDRLGEKSYFGICFTPTFPLKVEECHQLALFLFANPFTSFRETRNIINNIAVFPSKQNLINSLKHELEKITFSSSTCHDIILAAFNTKFIGWFSVYSFPAMTEINKVADILHIPNALFLNMLLELTINDNLEIGKMEEFLEKFGSSLTEYQINKTLDLYNLKKNEFKLNDSLKNGIQIQLFNSL